MAPNISPFLYYDEASCYWVRTPVLGQLRGCVPLSGAMPVELASMASVWHATHRRLPQAPIIEYPALDVGRWDKGQTY